MKQKKVKILKQRIKVEGENMEPNEEKVINYGGSSDF